MCKTLSVTRSAYYKWLNRKETMQEKADKELAERIKGCYEEHNGSLGYRMITDLINGDYKTDYKEKKVFRIIKCEMFYCCEFKNTEEIIQAINKYMLFYNYRRPQRRFNKQTPMYVRLEALKSKTLITQYLIAPNNKIINFHNMIKQKQMNYAII